MKVEVIEVFQDAVTFEHHQIGDFIEIDDKRAELLTELKLIKAVKTPTKRQPKKK